jgi:uncharacterized protein YkwD
MHAPVTRFALCLLALSSFSCTAAVGVDPSVADDDEANPDEGRSAESLALAEGLDVEEQAFLKKINEYRASNGLQPLQASVALTKAADYHSVDMATKNYFSHTSQDGTSFADRIKRYYNYNTYYAENIAAGNDTALATFEQWRTSPGHNTNMLSANYKVIGIARAYSATSTYRWYWTTDFGGYVDEVMTEGAAPPPPPPATNLIANGTFDAAVLTTGVGYASVRTPNAWHANWSSGGSVSISGGALHVKDPDPGSVTATQVVAAKAGVTYQLTARAKRPSGNSRQSIWVDFLNSSYGSLGRVRVYPSSLSTWNTVTTSGLAPAGTTYARVVVYGSSTAGYVSTFDWDDVSLTAK